MVCVLGADSVLHCHSGAVFCTVSSQQGASGFKPFCVEFSVLPAPAWLPPTVQKQDEMMNGQWCGRKYLQQLQVKLTFQTVQGNKISCHLIFSKDKTSSSLFCTETFRSRKQGLWWEMKQKHSSCFYFLHQSPVAEDFRDEPTHFKQSFRFRSELLLLQNLQNTNTTIFIIMKDQTHK